MLAQLRQRPKPVITRPKMVIKPDQDRTLMTLVFLIALAWLGMRTVLLLAQVDRHTPEARLGREFQQELRERGLIPPDPVERQA